MFKTCIKIFRVLCVTLLVGFPIASLAQQSSDEPLIVIEKPWARASIGTSRPGAAYLIVRNESSEAISLVGLRTDIAGMPSIHETRTNSDGISSMASADDILIPAGGMIALEPGGYHAMLMKLNAPLVKGETFMMTLLFSDGTEVETNVPVLGIGSRGPEG